MKDEREDLTTIAQAVAQKAAKRGAEGAEVLIRSGAELSVQVRLGEVELVKEAQSRALGLRVFVDRRAALTYTADLAPDALDRFIDDSIALARLAEPDELQVLPDPSEYADPEDLPELDLYCDEATTKDVAWAVDLAKRGETAARKHDPRVTNSDGASVGRGAGTSAFATSNGFAAASRGTSVSLSVEPICDDAGGKRRNAVYWTMARHLSGLDDPEAVGREAARRALGKLGAKKVPTREVPVIFSPDAGRGLLGALAGVATGSAFYRRSSYLVGREGTEIAAPLVTIVDDPLRVRGLGSRPFDGDGLASRLNTIVDKGVLATVLCDVYSARKLGRKSTGSAGRGVGGAPGPTTSNLVMLAGELSPEQIIAQTDGGLYVTDMMGFGFNAVTGDFSRGAAGFWVQNGELAQAVGEITISANFDALWKNVDLVGSDLDARTSVMCPTFRVATMMVAGS